VPDGPWLTGEPVRAREYDGSQLNGVPGRLVGDE
jgi:hypothetical protein